MPSTTGSYRIYQPRSEASMYIGDEFEDDEYKLDDEPNFALVTAVASKPLAYESGASGEFTVSHTGDTDAPFMAYYTVTGTATKGADYIALSGSVIIPAGLSSATIAVAAIDEYNASESDETVILTIKSDPTYAVGVPSAATVTIKNNSTPPPKPTVNLVTTTATTLEESGPPGEFTINRTGPTEQITVNYTVSGTADSGTDYETLSGSVVIGSGVSSATIQVVPIDDAEQERPETVIVTLSSSTDYALGASTTGTVTISDADGWTEPSANVTASVDTAYESPLSAGKFTIGRTIGSEGDIATTVYYTVSGSATAGND
jgi:hypothetical protein